MGSDVIGARTLAGLVLSQPAPSPTPEPISVNVPPPTVKVEPQVTIPPDLLDRLTPADPGWFTQPVATLIAALLALLAARIAWRGVQNQIHATADNVERQISAEHARHRRTERVAALVVTVELGERSHQALREATKAKTHGNADQMALTSQRLQDLHDERKVMLVRLQLLGMDSSSIAFGKLHFAINNAAKSLGKPEFQNLVLAMLLVKSALVDTYVKDLDVDLENARTEPSKKPWYRFGRAPQPAADNVRATPLDAALVENEKK